MLVKLDHEIRSHTDKRAIVDVFHDQFPHSGGVRFKLCSAFLAAAMSGLNSSTRSTVARGSPNRFGSQNVITRFIPRLLLPGARRNAPCHSPIAWFSCPLFASMTPRFVAA